MSFCIFNQHRLWADGTLNTATSPMLRRWAKFIETNKAMRTITFISFAFAIAFAFLSCDSQTSQKTEEDKTSQTEVQVHEPTEASEGKIGGNLGGCAFNSSASGNAITLYYPRPRETNQINTILEFSGLASNFKIYAANIDNAVATIINNKRYILYDPKLLAYTDQYSGSYWSSMSILAHEIGHHLSGHTITSKGSNPSDELEADKFSGFVLFKLGASLSQAKAAMEALGSPNESSTHPAKHRRLFAIETGWNEANEQRYSSAVPPPPSDDNNFGTEGYIKDEFTKEELISQSALSAENFGGIINTNYHPSLEGIIIDVSKEDPSGGERTDYFDDPKSDFNMVVTIQLTKVGSSPYNNNRKVGNREKFHLLDYYQMSKADLSWFEALMVPGRKIRFKSFYFGFEGEDIFYIKKLNRHGGEVQNTINSSSPSSTPSVVRFIVVASKAYFYSTPDFSRRKKAYLLAGETFSGSQQQGGFIYTTFINDRGQQTSGWIYSGDSQRQ